MPKYTSQIKSEESAEKVNSLIANFLAAQGYKPTANKKGSEWRKGFYWFKYVGYAYAQGIINIEVWNYCPYPGMGSFLMYFIGIEELKKLLKDLEEMLSRKPFPQGAVQAGDAEFQGATAGDAVLENRKEAELLPQAVLAPQKKTVVGFAKVWIGFLIIGNLAATCAPINQLTIPSASGITAIVMLLSGAIAAGYIMLYNKNPFGLYLVLIANLLALSMNSPSVLVKTGLIPGIITFFITYKQIAYPFGKPAVTKTNPNPIVSDNLVISRQQNTNPDVIVPQAVPVSKPAPAMAATASTPLPEMQTPVLQKQPEAAEYVNQGGQNETSTLNAVSVNAHPSASPVLHSSTPIKRPRLPVWGWACIIAGVMGCLFLIGIAGLVGVRWALSGSSQQTSAAPAESPAIQMPGVISTATNERIPQGQEPQATKEPVAGLPGSSVPAIPGSISPQNINQVSEEAHTEENSQDGPLFCHQVAWSLDNERIAIASNSVHIFDFITGNEEVTITGLGWVNSIVSAPDGKVATSSDSGGVQLWDPVSNTEIRDFAKEAESTQKLAISPDGKILAATTDSGFTLFDIETGQQILAVENDSGPYNLAFSPDGKILAGGGAELKLWDVQDGHEIRMLKGGGDAINSVAFSPDGKVLASALGDNTIKLWDVVGGNEIMTLSGHTNTVDAVDFSPDGRLLASLSRDHTIRFWDMSSGKELGSLTYNTDIPQDIRFSPDGTMIAACGLGSAMRIWGLPNSKASQPTATWAPPTPTVQPANAPVIQKSSQLDLRLGAKQLIWPGDNQVLIGDYGIQVYDPTNNSNTPIGDEQWITSMAVSPDGKTLAISEYEAIKLFSLDGQGGKTLGKGGDNTKLAFSPDGKTLAASVNQAVKLYDVASGTDLTTIPIQASWMQDIVFSPDGKSLVIVSANDVSVWDIASGSQSKSFSEHVRSPKTISFSPDGKILAVGGSDEGDVGKIVLWDFADGQWLRTLTGHKNTVNNMVFSPDGRWLASGSADLTIRLWDVTSGNLMNTLTGHTTPVNAVAFSPDGKMLASAGDDAVIFWKITPGE